MKHSNELNLLNFGGTEGETEKEFHEALRKALENMNNMRVSAKGAFKFSVDFYLTTNETREELFTSVSHSFTPKQPSIRHGRKAFINKTREGMRLNEAVLSDPDQTDIFDDAEEALNEAQNNLMKMKQ